MGNRVHIMKRKHLRDQYAEVQVSDENDQSAWFLLDPMSHEAAEHFAMRCMKENRQAREILQAAIENNTRIYALDNEINGAILQKFLEEHQAQEKALAEKALNANQGSASPRF